MAKKLPIRGALDLETTGLHAEQDSILEVAAIKFQGDTVLDTLEALVAPGRSIPYRVQRLTGITPQKLVGAPHFESISRNLQLFIGDYPIVGHSIPFDVSFLRRRGLVRTNPLIDTFELATVLLPSLPSYNLGQVAEALGVIVAPGRHRAMVDTVLAMHVFLALYERLQSVYLALLKDLASLDAPRTWPLLGFFRQELREREERDGLRGLPSRGSLGDRFAAQLGMDPRVLSFAIARQDDTVAPPGPEGFDADGSVATSDGEQVNQAPEQTEGIRPPERALDTFEQMQTLVEVIPEQAEQPTPLGYKAARTAVREALEQHTSLLMEVTVGGSDYTPALLPALEWLSESLVKKNEPPRRLVITCSNSQYARRLVETILPRLQALLKIQVPVAYLAEQDGYLCIHRWFGAALRRTSGELTAEQARGLAKLGLWARISSGVEGIPSADEHSGTASERCIYYRKGYCFVKRAEERVNAATVVVTTHIGLLDDLYRSPNQGSHSLLASIDRRLILDADFLEEEIARWSSSELDQTHLLGLLGTIGTELPDGRFQGLLALAAPALRENGPGGLSITPTVAKTELDARMHTWFQTLDHGSTAVNKLFNCFGQLLEEFLQQGSGGGRDKGRGSHGGRAIERVDQPLRLTGQARNLSTWASRSEEHTSELQSH